MANHLNLLLERNRSSISPMADISVYRDLVQQYDSLINVPERGKSNATASALRLEGNRLYQAKRYEDALAKYNESICFAETDSEDLAIGYANRSAVYYEMGEYEFALYNIILAKKSHYPERLMLKLTNREKGCREKCGAKPLRIGSTTQFQTIKDANPKIPFLAKGICVKTLPEFGSGLVAERDFLAGDVILNERPVLTTNVMNYSACGLCSKINGHRLIPCPNCVYVMYCSEECRKMAKKTTHRFECGVATKIFNLSLASIGANFFFYGLTLFNDNLQDMMKFCQQNPATGVDPLILDYVNYDPLKEFEALHKAKGICYPNREFDYRLHAALLCNIYEKHPLIKAIVVSAAEKDFMLRQLLSYMRSINQHSLTSHNKRVGALCPIAGLLNHSCDPNALGNVFGPDQGRATLVLLRPVSKGEQICVSYGPTWWQPHAPAVSRLSFKCACVVCKCGGALLYTGESRLPPRLRSDFELCKGSANEPDMLNLIQRYVQRYAYVHPEPFFGSVLQQYNRVLLVAMAEELDRIERAEVAACVL